MQNIKLAFYKGMKPRNPNATWLDTIICLLTKSEYSHVELIYHMDYVTREAKVWSSSPRDKGVRNTTITMVPDHWDIYTLDLVEKPALHIWFIKESGKPYDWLGALGVKFNFFKQEESKWFCSEIIGAYLNLPNYHRLSPIKLFNALGTRLTKLEF